MSTTEERQLGYAHEYYVLGGLKNDKLYSTTRLTQTIIFKKARNG